MGILDRTLDKWSEAAARGKGTNIIRTGLLITLAAGLVVLGIWLARAEPPRTAMGEQLASLVALVPLLASLGLLALAAASLMIGVLSFLRTGKWG